MAHKKYTQTTCNLCDKPHYCRGLCVAHYMQGWRANWRLSREDRRKKWTPGLDGYEISLREKRRKWIEMITRQQG